MKRTLNPWEKCPQDPACTGSGAHCCADCQFFQEWNDGYSKALADVARDLEDAAFLGDSYTGDEIRVCLVAADRYTAAAKELL